MITDGKKRMVTDHGYSLATRLWYTEAASLSSVYPVSFQTLYPLRTAQCSAACSGRAKGRGVKRGEGVKRWGINRRRIVLTGKTRDAGKHRRRIAAQSPL